VRSSLLALAALLQARPSKGVDEIQSANVVTTRMTRGFDSAYTRTPPPVVEIYREVLRPGGSFAHYRALEDSAARLCRELGCPHPYLGLESVSGVKEVWYLNFFESQSDVDRVGKLYAAVPRLNELLGRFVAEKASLVTASNIFARLQKHPRTRWQLAGARFLVAVVPATSTVGDAANYVDSSGASFAFAFASTRAEANDLVRRLGRNARVLEIKPAWSLPHGSWGLTSNVPQRPVTGTKRRRQSGK
jgi:hypothetical protein